MMLIDEVAMVKILFSEIPVLPFSTLVMETTLALEGVFAAGNAILDVYKQDFKTTFKAEQEPLTEADLRSNTILLAALQKTNIPILSEETADFSGRVSNDTIWIIDPLDGTKEFIQKNGEFVIMIALVKKGTPILGIVYQPTTGMLYLAQQGQGVFEKNGQSWKRLHVSTVDDIMQARAVLSKSHLKEKDRQFMDEIGVSNFSQKGSAGLKIGLLCSGEADFYFNPSDKVKEWDTAAGYCMITEAGGSMTDLFGKELCYNQADVVHRKGILVSNGKLQQQLVERLKAFYQ